MNKTLKHIKQHTEYVDAERLTSVYLTKDKQLSCYFIDGDNIKPRLKFSGSIQKIYNDADGNAYGYDIYLY